MNNNNNNNLVFSFDFLFLFISDYSCKEKPNKSELYRWTLSISLCSIIDVINIYQVWWHIQFHQQVAPLIGHVFVDQNINQTCSSTSIPHWTMHFRHAWSYKWIQQQTTRIQSCRMHLISLETPLSINICFTYSVKS